MSRLASTSPATDESVQLIGAAARVVALLEAVSAAPSSVGVRELSRVTGIDKSAVSRLLVQLQGLGMVEQAQGVQGRYTIGSRFYAIGSLVSARDSLVNAANLIMRRLVDATEETCYLAAREQDELVFRDKVDCHKPIRYVLEMDRPIALHAGAGGRAVLSGMSPQEAGEVLRRIPLKALTAQTITDAKALLALAAEDRTRGFSASIGERVIGGAAIAAPYFAGDGSCRGALVLTIPSERLDPARVPDMGAAVSAASRELSIRLGHGDSWRDAHPTP